jgi:sulfite exporter TauE/SafE
MSQPGIEHQTKKTKLPIILSSILILAFAWFIGVNHGWLDFLKKLYLLKYLPELKPDSSYSLLLLFGVLTSFHCIGMCGGIALSQGITGAEDRELNQRKGWFRPSLLYNLGRVLSYTLIGGVVGGLGHLLRFSGIWKGIVPIIGGLFMVMMGLNLFGWFPFLRRLNPRMPAFLTRKLNLANHYGSLTIGLLSGLLPCGPLQAAQIYALSTESIIKGAISMLIFAVGTVPLLLGFGVVNSLLSHKFTRIVLKFSAVLVIILGIGMVTRGLALTGVSFEINPLQEIDQDGIAIVHGVDQTVVTTIQSNKFSPIIVQKGRPVLWTIKVNPKNLNGCNNAMIIPKYNLKKSLVVGDNLVCFTPKEEGVIAYTCWMGMIKSKITVVADIAKLKAKLKSK